MAQKATVRKLAREAEGQRTPDDALDDKRMALYLAQEWTDDVAHTCGFGWFRRGPGGLWVPDPNGVEVRNRIRRVLTGSKIARRGVRTRDVARELADELNVEVDAWNGGDVLGLTSDSSDPCAGRHLCQAIEAWRDANRATGRCWRCGADKGNSPYRDCDGCRRVNAESCRRYRARKAALRDKRKARYEWRATAAADERARWLRGARLRWLGKVSALFLRRGRPQSVTLPNHLVVEKFQLDIEAAQLGIRGWD